MILYSRGLRGQIANLLFRRFESYQYLHVAVAQVARASDCGSEGYGFEFRQSPHRSLV